jgi:hypothetical protein
VIVRILGEGQYEIADAVEAHLNGLDAALESAVEAKDEARFTEALSTLLEAVRRDGTLLDASRIVPSDLALPAPGSSLDEVIELLNNDAPAEA